MTELVDLEIHEITIGASQSTGTSPATESIALLNPKIINPEKYEHPCQVDDLNRVDMFHHKDPDNLSEKLWQTFLFHHE